MSHVSMAAFAASIVLIAALALVYVSRHFHEHPGAGLLMLLGVPVLAILVFVIARKRT